MEHLGQPDNTPEARTARMLAWQYVLPKVVEVPLEIPQNGRDDFLDNISDLNANVVDIRPPDISA